MLSAISTSGVDFANYTSSTWDINGLTDPVNQDIVYAQAIPEPGSALLLLIALAGLFWGHRPVRKAAA
ncbi:MAG: PEP-CTERM sorting domain-containing protein [Verrucomicrobiales bacterium]|nr:PEP-CTERM sorting domain-containing protein [Verrucomicrobiales bacterium]